MKGKEKVRGKRERKDTPSKSQIPCKNFRLKRKNTSLAGGTPKKIRREEKITKKRKGTLSKGRDEKENNENANEKEV